VWQHTPEHMAAKKEQWRCRCTPERETAENVCGSKGWSKSPPRRCVATDASVTPGYASTEVEVKIL